MTGMDRLKTFLKSIPLIGDAFRCVGRMRWRYHRWKVDPARRLRNLLRDRKDLVIVQIGSNDGATFDPIYGLLQQNPSWKALLVEPVPFLFDRLRQNYSANGNVRFENVAVTHSAGQAAFHYVDSSASECFPDLPVWFDQLGSFDRSHIIRHLGTKVEPFIVGKEVATASLDSILERNDISRIDVLHIDTEGYDWQVLQQLDRRRFEPAVILFEYKHLADDDRIAAVEFLKSDYRISDLDVSGDYLCERIRPSI